MKKRVVTGLLLILFVTAFFAAVYVLFNKYNETYGYDQISNGRVDRINYKDPKVKEEQDILFFAAEDNKDKESLKIMVFEKDFLFKSRYRKRYEEVKSQSLNSIYYGTDKDGYIVIFGKNTKDSPINSFEVISSESKSFDVKEEGTILEIMKGKAKDIKDLRIEYDQEQSEI
ncbi:hypothetical protein [Lagierella sp.]|uniref:hypothetical protein n=1 Tax=Lagierella sp. TaxID=2849657 RepID=UPI002612F354|nr:hypothetical protein [Lagierella sp.]